MLASHQRGTLRYDADESFALPALSDLVTAAGGQPANGSPLSEGDGPRQRLETVYFDTPDLRLASVGVTLRRRTGGDDSGWHLGAPAAPTGSVVRLPPGRLPPGRTPRTVPEQLQSMVWAQTLGRPLQPVAKVTTERSVWRLSDPTGHVLIEVIDDRNEAMRLLPMSGDGLAIGAPTRWREIEIDLDTGIGDLTDALDGGLRRSGLRKAAWSGLAHVLDGARPTQAEAGNKKPGKGRRLTAKSTAGDVVLTHIGEQVAQVRSHDMPVRLNAPDAVHKMRVATRRLRSALSTFQPLFEPDVVRPLRAELKWLAGELGAARDAEVMRDRVRAAVADEEAAASVSADAAQNELDAAYRTAHDRVLAELDGDRYHRILTALQDLSEQPPLRRRAKASAGTALPGLVGRTYDQVRSLVTEAESRPAGPEQEELWHDARKAAKQSRYAAESVAPVFGKDASTFAAAMEAVQEALGEHQDSVLTRERLHALALEAPSTEVAFLYGRLHAQEQARSAESHERFTAAWNAAGRKSLHRWLR